MEDFKGQLAALRNQVRKSELPERIQNRSRKKVPVSRDKGAGTSSDLMGLALGTLPMIGVIEDYVESKRHGSISFGHSLFFHASNRLHTGHVPAGEDVVGRKVLFIPGSSPRDQRGRVRVVRWCLLDDLPWVEAPATQNALDELRAAWFETQPIEVRLAILEGKWYWEQWRGDDIPRNLHDEVLRHGLLDAFKELPSERLVTLNLRSHFERSPYEFTRLWLLNEVHFGCGHLMSRLSPEQLVAFGAPKMEWLPEAEESQRAGLLAWALLSNLTPSDRNSWNALITGSESWAEGLAEILAASKWQNSAERSAWKKAVLVSAQAAPRRAAGSTTADGLGSIPWFDLLSLPRQISILAEGAFNIDELVELLRERGDPDLVSAFVTARALAVDLETDGERIWEIGTASSDGRQLLFQQQEGASQQVALDELKIKLSSSYLVIGHNLLAWDWPVIKHRLENCEDPVMWDTLLVEALFRPWASSLALGGSHRAHDDAAQAFELFKEQLRRLPSEVGLALLRGDFRSTTDLMAAVTMAVHELEWTLPPPPDWLAVARKKADGGQILMLPGAQIRALNWCPNVAVVPALDSDPLPVELLEISSESLLRVIGVTPCKDPFTQTVVSIVSKATRLGIRVRMEMLPLWLRENVSVESLLRQALEEPTARDADLCVAIPPSSGDWGSAAQAHHYLFLAPPPHWEISDRRLLTGRDLKEVLGVGSSIGENRQPRLDDAFFKLISRGPDETAWLLLDRTIKSLPQQDGPWRHFKAIRFPDRGFASVLANVPEATNPPRLLLRIGDVLNPGTEDQSGYWKEALRVLAALKARADSRQIPLLLVSSSCSRELLVRLQQAIAEVGLGEVYHDHHSRSEKLRRASRSGHCLVDQVSNWLAWRALAEQLGISICPVLDAVPLEEWYAARPCSPGPTSKHETGDSRSVGIDWGEHDYDDAEDNESVSDAIFEPQPVHGCFTSDIRRSELLELLPELTKDNLRRWLWTEGLSDYEVPPLIIDGRLSARARALRDVLELYSLIDFDFGLDQASRLADAMTCFRIERQEAPSDYDSMRKFLVEHWNRGRTPAAPGFIADFREATQRPAIEAIRGRDNDVVVTLPTGEGKSVLFQVPALCRGLRTRRLTLVISPLRALMRDQVERLAELGFQDSVDYLSADRAFHETEDAFQGILDHRLVLLYVAPERFRNSRFRDALDKRVQSDDGLEYIVVDEAHCVSQWGYEFRPDYFYALNLLQNEYRGKKVTNPPPFIMLSATITSSNRAQLEALTRTPQAEDEERAFPFVATPKGFSNPLRDHIAVEPRKVAGNIAVRPGEYWPIETRLTEIAEVCQRASENLKITGQHSAVLIFVTRRDHAEQLASRIRDEGLGKTEYFHAGLDAGARQEIYEQFRRGQLDILVATKAFGMGMDIPHIHWAVHLSPPAYLEDYLQEVGRIGRGAEERAKAGLDQLKAILLFSEDDFQSIRTRRAGDVVAFRQVADWYDKIRGAGQSLNDRIVAIVPDAGFDPPVSSGKRRATANQLRVALYWMERLGKVTIEAMVSGLLPVNINATRVRELARSESGALAAVAESVAALVSAPVAENIASAEQNRVAPGLEQHSRQHGWLGGLLRSLGQMVGIVFGQAAIPAEPNSLPIANQGTDAEVKSRPSSGDVEAILNISTICKDTALANTDEVLGLIAKMESLGALRIQRNISFATRPLARVGPQLTEALFSMVGRAVEEILSELQRHGRLTIDFHDLALRIGTHSVPPEHTKDAWQALEWSVTYMLRQIGVRVRQDVSRDGVAELRAEVVRSAIGLSRNRAQKILIIARHLWPVFQTHIQDGAHSISITTLISAVCEAVPGRKFREYELRRAAGLLSKMRLVSISEPVTPMSYALSLADSTEGLSEGEDQEVWAELAKVNRFSELRCFAMEMFARLPPEAQNKFITEYFTKDSPGELEEFLDGQLGEMVDISEQEGEATSFVAKKREELRAEAVQEFFARYTEWPEEPNQWGAISHPFNRHLLVNAGPGSGKTSVLLARVAHLIRVQNLRPEQILVLSFNRAVVFEIRTRIRELFSKLGYGAYVRHLQAYTFHGFATRHMRSVDEGDERTQALEAVLSNFADRLEEESGFRTEVAGGIRAILVDEFQDTNEDIFRIICEIARAAGPGAGVMVIGDDDQDILTWNRRPPESSSRFFQHFSEEFSLGEEQKLVLRVNFRSGKDIVDHSQEFLEKRLHALNGKSRRLKDERLSPANAAPTARVAELDAAERDWESILLNAGEKVASVAQSEEPSSLAILCRTNAEVASAYLTLRDSWPGLAVQASDKSRAARLRHLGLFVDLLNSELAKSKNRPLDEGLLQEMLSNYLSLDIPEVRNPPEGIITPEQLWELCCRIQSYPHLHDLINLIGGLDLDELMLLLGAQGGSRSYAVVSTIHKVKGLEFDRVMILPSTAQFVAGDSGDIISEAAAEARLMYVAMTRAKRSLRYYLGPREKSWMSGVPMRGTVGSGRMLQGTPKEVSLGWAWSQNAFNQDPDSCQAYIEREVAIGDRLEVGGVGAGKGRALLHRNSKGSPRQIGFLANAMGAAGPSHDLIVSSVIRYKVDPETETRAEGLAPRVRERGWGYVVVPAGVLR